MFFVYNQTKETFKANVNRKKTLSGHSKEHIDRHHMYVNYVSIDRFRLSIIIFWYVCLIVI